MSEREEAHDTHCEQGDITSTASVQGQTGPIPSFLERHASPTCADAAPEEDGRRCPLAADAAADPAADAAPASPDESTGERDGAGGEGISYAVGSFFSEGVASVKAMNAARRAHAEAREELERLENTIAAREKELEHRRDVEGRYGEIVRSEQDRKLAADKAAKAAHERREELVEQIETLKLELKQMCEEDDTAEKRLKAVLDAASDKEKSAKEAERRLQNRLDDAKRDLDRRNEERRASMLATEQQISSAESHLATLNAEYAELQRNPSANTAEYSVRSRELELEISDAAAALRDAREGLPQIDRETQGAIEEALRAVEEAQRPISAAKSAREKAAGETERARKAHDASKDEAESRQNELRRRISDKDKASKEFERERERKLQEAAEAQSLIDEAEDIHAHPEVTEAIAGALAADRAELGDRKAEVDALAGEEKAVREKTRGSRVRFIAAIVAVVAVAAALAAWALFA